MSTLAKYGTPQWKPISKTRHATVRAVFKVECIGCSYIDPIDYHFDIHANRAQAQHDRGHANDVASCCMHATGPVCECGNILV